MGSNLAPSNETPCWFICFSLEYYLLGKRNDTHLVFAYWIFCLKIDSWRVLINLFLTVKWFMLLLCRVKPKVWRFCLPKVRLSAPKSDVAELAYSSPEIFANGGSWTKNLLYFRVQLLKKFCWEKSFIKTRFGDTPSHKWVSQ